MCTDGWHVGVYEYGRYWLGGERIGSGNSNYAVMVYRTPYSRDSRDSSSTGIRTSHSSTHQLNTKSTRV